MNASAAWLSALPVSMHNKDNAMEMAEDTLPDQVARQVRPLAVAVS